MSDEQISNPQTSDDEANSSLPQEALDRLKAIGIDLSSSSELPNIPYIHCIKTPLSPQNEVYSSSSNNICFEEDAITITDSDTSFSGNFDGPLGHSNTIRITGTNNYFRGAFGKINIWTNVIFGDKDTTRPIKIGFEQCLYTHNLKNDSDYPAKIFLWAEQMIILAESGEQLQNHSYGKYAIYTMPPHSENILELTGTALSFFEAAD